MVIHVWVFAKLIDLSAVDPALTSRNTKCHPTNKCQVCDPTNHREPSQHASTKNAHDTTVSVRLTVVIRRLYHHQLR